MPVVLVPRPGEAFGTASRAARPPGAHRIAGASAILDDACRRRIHASLGESARILDASALGVIADFDGCSVAGVPLATEAAFAAVIHDGRLGQVEGAFVVAWADGAGSLHVARDPIGHRTVYYALRDRQLVFASKLRTLLEVFGLPRRLDLRSLAAFLSCAYIPGRGTMIDGVFELLPGESVHVRDGELERTAFWDLPPEPAILDDEPALRDRLRRELERVIRAALPVGEPVCASLSGGIDSSLVLALARRLHPREVRTFSITFGDEYRNELPFSSLVAAHTGTEHHVVELRPATIVAHLDDTIARMDKPNGDPLTVPNALLFREMSAYGRIVLNGEGGDPCFGGPKNLPMVLAELYGEHDGGDPQYARERSFLRAHLKCFDDLAQMLAPTAHATACTPPLEQGLAPWFHDPRWPSFVGTLMAINVRFKGGHHILPKVDALAEPFGVLPRSPLFAKSIVELAFTIPSTLKLAGSVEKYLLKEAVRDLLPDAIVDRGKSGMLVPVEGWFQGPLQQHARERLLDGRLGKGPLFRRPMLEQLLAGKHLGLRPRRGVKLWLLITLEAHLRTLGIEA
jgi:asparagine synthase (glutamine-hydrolysing)